MDGGADMYASCKPSTFVSLPQTGRELPADVALTKAKLELKKKNPNPFYWGALGITSGAN